MRRRSLLIALTLTALAALATIASVSLAEGPHKPKCVVVNVGVHQSYGSLQEAADAASAGDTLKVRGTCEGEVTISKDLTIKGKGAATLRRENPLQFRALFTVNAGSTVTITDLTITGGGFWGIDNSGTLRVVKSTITDNSGGISSNGSLMVSESSVSGNHLSEGDPVGISVSGSATIKDSTITGNVGGRGGGIHNSGSLTIKDSTVSNNTATEIGGHCHLCREGGGIKNEGSLTVISSTIANNTAEGLGGGIASAGGSVTLKNSTVTSNTAASGGGLSNLDLGSLTLTNSTVTSNAAVATTNGEGEGFPVGGNGGGILNEGSLALARSSSVTENRAVVHGGGIFNAESNGAMISYAPHWRGTVSDNKPDDIFNE